MVEAGSENWGWIYEKTSILSFRKKLFAWGRLNFRPFPWRLTNDPYLILLAEIMLHRTQVTQVVPVYQSFISKFPNISSLININLQDLQTSLFSLGLNWRISLIYKMMEMISERFEKQIPKDKNDLLSLPGISEYIAAAVRCFAWNFPEPIIDTNTVRITGRLFGLEIKDSSRRNPRFRTLITAMVDPENPRAYNYALLDLAHVVCLKKHDPLCQECPIKIYCRYGNQRSRNG